MRRDKEKKKMQHNQNLHLNLVDPGRGCLIVAALYNENLNTTN
jgi:hypothetical protein